jgi:hypothetical protein
MGFYGNRTAQEVDSPADLVDGLILDPQALALVRGRRAVLVPAELGAAAAARGFELSDVASVPCGSGEFFSLVRAQSRPVPPK